MSTVMRLPVCSDKSAILVMNEVRVSSLYLAEFVTDRADAANERVRTAVSFSVSPEDIPKVTFRFTFSWLVATINAWKPKIQQSDAIKLSQIWILGGSFGQHLNSIEAGWQVNLDLYGDNNTRPVECLCNHLSKPFSSNNVSNMEH